MSSSPPEFIEDYAPGECVAPPPRVVTPVESWSERLRRQALNAAAVIHSPITSTAIIQTWKNRSKPRPL